MWFRRVFRRFGVIVFSVVLLPLLVLIAYFRLPWLFLYFYLAKWLYSLNVCADFSACASFLRVVILVASCVVPVLMVVFVSFVLFFSIVFLRNPQAVFRERIMSFFVRKRYLVLEASLVLVLLLIVFECTIPFTFLSTYRREVDEFISGIEGHVEEAERVFDEVVGFVDSHINCSYGRPESEFEIDVFLTPIDYLILSLEGYDRVHVILFQGWGSCGQYAAIVEYLLRRLGYETRVARFVNMDHEWAEVRLNSSWYIVDPWYLGKGSVLVLASELGSRFRYCKGVTVFYPNGTVGDAGVEHGCYG